MSDAAHMKSIQAGLAGLRYSPGPIDGAWGPKTESAVRALLSAGGKAAPEPVQVSVSSKAGPGTVIRQGSAGHIVREIVVHCSATRPSWLAGKSAKAKAAEIRRWHMQDRGWRDIGYHWVIDRDGTIVAGRAENVVGSHVLDRNIGTIGVCLVGGHGSSENDRFEDNFTTEQRRALLGLIADISTRTPVNRVSGHNEFAPKACPGFNVPNFMKVAA